ncbi:MAG: hypothetical protein ACI9TB_002554, partial [Parasphingorhabdus sp.]
MTIIIALAVMGFSKTGQCCIYGFTVSHGVVNSQNPCFR